MTNKNLIVHKLSFSGKLLDVSTLNLLSLFGPTSIIPIYDKKSKILYTWIGDKAPQSLRNFIPEIRKILMEKYPQNSILRYVTVDAYSEPIDFLSLIQIDKAQLENQLKNLERKRISIIGDLDELKIRENNLLITNQFDDAIKIAEEIIELAKELNDIAIQEEQKKIIEKILDKQEKSTKVSFIEDLTAELFPKLENLQHPSEIINVHELVSKFKEEWGEIIRLFKIKSALQLIREEKTLWKDFISTQQQKLTIIREEIQQINNGIIKVPIEKLREDIGVINRKLTHLIDYEIILGWIDQKKNLEETLGTFELKSKALSSLKKADEYINTLEYDVALKELNNVLKEIKNTTLSEEIDSIEERIAKISIAQEIFLKNQQKLQNLEESYRKALEKDNLQIALMCSEEIVSLSKELKKSMLFQKYSQITAQLREKLDKRESARNRERERLKQQAKELENIINVDQDVLPLMEEYSIDEVLGDLSGDVDEILNQLGGLLHTHRVDVKEEIHSKALIKSNSGEIIELEKTNTTKKNKDGIGTSVSSGLTNPFDEMIEKAILTDLIPYNYEINSVEMDGGPIDEIPDKELTREGLEINWTLQAINPGRKVHIEYNLRRRVSRTIIFILKGNLKVIKTHSGLKQLDLEGFFEAEMPFSNNFGIIIEGVVVEDIIPLYYIHTIKEPENLLPDKTMKTQSGEFLMWNMQSLLPDKTRNYHYHLLELFKFEELKISVNELNKKATTDLNEGAVKKAVEKYQTIVSLLNKYLI
ncbi:MAG: hypothetical protein BAJALOKI1v1_420002 [Promethearchaeota archaeon]|nr:MAG: hypothetical protein BAJALOKI1v1_420002 [Candidatus Lokiarchaeota archaeon]